MAISKVTPLGIYTGAVLQTITATTSSQVANSTNVAANVGLSATITPVSTSSRILVITNIMGVTKDATSSDNRIKFILNRNGSQIEASDANNWTQGTAMYLRISFAHSFIDSPSSVSALTYSWQFFNANNTAAAYVQKDGNSGTSQITLMEIAG